MEKRVYLGIFLTIVIGMMIGFSLGSIDQTRPWHVLQDVYNGSSLQLSGSVDADGNGIIDKADSVVGGGSYYFLNNPAAIVTSGTFNVPTTWQTFSVAGSVRPTDTAKYAIFDVFLGTTNACPSIFLQFRRTGNTAAQVTAANQFIGGTQFNTQYQVIAPLDVNQNFDMMINSKPVCTYQVWLVGYIY